MDYRELLKKYLIHVGDQEGTYLLGHKYCSLNDPFSEEEHKELRNLVEEATIEI